MRQFLIYGHVLSTEEAELYADYELKKNPPTLDNFKEQVYVTTYYVYRCSVLEQFLLLLSSVKISNYHTVLRQRSTSLSLCMFG